MKTFTKKIVMGIVMAVSLVSLNACSSSANCETLISDKDHLYCLVHSSGLSPNRHNIPLQHPISSFDDSMLSHRAVRLSQSSKAVYVNKSYLSAISSQNNHFEDFLLATLPHSSSMRASRPQLKR